MIRKNGIVNPKGDNNVYNFYPACQTLKKQKQKQKQKNTILNIMYIIWYSYRPTSPIFEFKLKLFFKKKMQPNNLYNSDKQLL